MLDDLREKLRAVRQSYTDDLNQLMDEVKQEKISGDEYRTSFAPETTVTNMRDYARKS